MEVNEAFVLAHTMPARAPLVPELTLHLATEITPIWKASEEFLRRVGVDPPFWAFAWPGAQALARLVLDRPGLVAGRSVLDFAAGCGLTAIACVRAGAASVEACELDPLAGTAMAVNAAANDAPLRITVGDLVGTGRRWDVILCGDICYEAPMTAHVMPWLRAMAADGALVLIADPGRAYLPADLEATGVAYDVPTSRELEDREVRRTRIFRLGGGADHAAADDLRAV